MKRDHSDDSQINSVTRRDSPEAHAKDTPFSFESDINNKSLDEQFGNEQNKRYFCDDHRFFFPQNTSQVKSLLTSILLNFFYNDDLVE